MANEPIRLLLVDDEERMRSILRNELRRKGFEVDQASSGEEALARVESQSYDVVLLDLRMPGMNGLEVLGRLRENPPAPEVIIITGHGTIDTAIEAMRLGAYHYVTKPFKLRELELHIRKAREKIALEKKSRQLERLVRDGSASPGIVGQSPALLKVLSLIEKIAPTDSPALITGESGTGKELVARSIHTKSLRADAPFVVVNCGTLQETLLETELFGHEKGAFTGAVAAREGLFEVAHKGTLFLDEIGEMSPVLQVKLLRALQQGEIRRLGSNRSINVDARVIAATNVDLKGAISAGRFREDLFYRINVFPIEMPPLRDRREDIALLVGHFLAVISVPGKGPFSITEQAMEALARYSWPGNVRELMNTVERMKILADGSTLDLAAVPAEVLGESRSEALSCLDPNLPMATVERLHILQVLRHTGGNKTRAAATLGISTRTLYNKLAEYGEMEGKG
jgi:DNA-binding NtrC family response regulator